MDNKQNQNKLIDPLFVKMYSEYLSVVHNFTHSPTFYVSNVSSDGKISISSNRTPTKAAKTTTYDADKQEEKDRNDSKQEMQDGNSEWIAQGEWFFNNDEEGVELEDDDTKKKIYLEYILAEQQKLNN